ncbi:non-ribosomal peptide synthetase [Rhizobium daejeonense]|uniref:Non-ribosomal peptide synthetase n=2 Tax=Rhizobium daejeonense TaxID=240521 RepID=A0A6M1SAP2_9HYPH|nr:non-ribosomal peptide synthetase [Rhizobium daejeonense]
MNGASIASDGGLQRRAHYDRQRSIHDIFRDHAHSDPDARALVFGGYSLTYGELDRLSDALAAYLLSCGVGKGEVVALLVPRALSTVVAKLGILKAGAAYLPVDPAFPADHLAYVIGECAPKVIFIDSAHGPDIDLPAVGAGKVVDLSALLPTLTAGISCTLPEVGGADPAYVMYTSGSTGRPKGVVIPHRGIARLVLDQNYVLFDHEDVVLHTATISFDAATFEIWGALLNGSTLAGMPAGSFSLAELSNVIRENGVTVMLLTTGLFNLFADHAVGDLPSLRHVFFGGEAGSVEHARRFQNAHPGCRLTNAYGPTEATVIATTFTIPAGFDAKDLPIGSAIANTDLLILDENMRPLAAGAEGQLALAGDGLAIGYVNRPDLTAEKFVTVETGEGGEVRCYLTGDLATMGADGTLFFKGRRDRQIKINGKRIELDEIEAALRRDPRVLDAVVACHEQGPSLKRIVAYLHPRSESDVDNPGFLPAVMEKLRSALPAYMIPSAAMVLKEFPLTQAGKTDRAKLPLPPVESAKPEAPESRSEEILTRLWQEALGATEIPVDRNFFDLGGTSLQLLKVHAGLETELGRNVDVIALFKHPTIRELARFLDGKTPQASRAMTPDRRAALQRRTVSNFRRSST